jgi:peptidoglycan/LPS O-acetylase OafA/YrhL
VPRPVDRRSRYEPALDGIRAVAVLAVLLYHLGVEQAPGGLLGVGVFFTLSGYLITSILISSWQRTGGLELGTFWLRRARRLLPALALVLLAVLAATVIAEPQLVGERAGESVAAGLYVANWASIIGGESYFEQIAGPGPLDHLWSLAIEEQFYLLWPLALLGLLWLTRGDLKRTGALTLGLAATSFVLLGTMAQSGIDNTRAYQGTDTRAGGLLIGAALALLWRPGAVRTRSGTAVPSAVVDGVGIVALGVIVWLVATTNDASLDLYAWGILALSIATAALCTVAVDPASRLVRPALSIAPMRWIGERSYGIYLWHLPLIAFMPPTILENAPWARSALLIGLTLGIAALSWRFLEDPIRRGGFSARQPVASPAATAPSDDAAVSAPAAAVAAGLADLWSPVRAPRARRSAMRSLALGTTLVAFVATSTLSASAMLGPSARDDAEAARATVDSAASIIVTGPDLADPEPAPSSTPTPSASAAPTAAPSTAKRATTAPTTSCRRVTHIGDSTSTGLISTDYLPKPADRIDAQYRSVGAVKVWTDIAGARSIVERYKDQPNAAEAVGSQIAKGFEGCWVIAMGTNEAANQAVGSRIDSRERIDRVMSQVADRPVLWLTVKTLRTKGPYADKGMRAWNAELVAACQRYPNLRVYDWAQQVDDDWYISDGIHFTSAGYKQRARLTAHALATAFPAGSAPAPGCIVTAP